MKTGRKAAVLAGSVAATVFAVTLAAQQPPPPAAATATTRTVWDGVYTEAQAERGQGSYARSCNKCHALTEGVPQRFTGHAFWAAWGEDTLETLHASVRRMPNDAPGSLSDATYADIIAFLLQSNGVPPGAVELNADAPRTTRLTTRDGRLPVGAFVAVTGCLTKAADGWTVVRASAPQRSRGATAAAQPLGDATYRLMYVITPLDKMQSHTVVVRGLLMGQPADGVNVTTVQSVASSCAS